MAVTWFKNENTEEKDFWMSMEGAGGTKRSFIQEYVEQNEKKATMQ